MQGSREADVTCLVRPHVWFIPRTKIDAVDYAITHWLNILIGFIFQRLSLEGATFQNSLVHTTFQRLFFRLYKKELNI